MNSVDKILMNRLKNKIIKKVIENGQKQREDLQRYDEIVGNDRQINNENNESGKTGDCFDKKN